MKSKIIKKKDYNSWIYNGLKIGNHITLPDQYGHMVNGKIKLLWKQNGACFVTVHIPNSGYRSVRVY